MLLMIDNYDSFTYNLVQYFRGLGQRVEVLRNDEADLETLMRLSPDYLVVSPGPGGPEKAGISEEAVRYFASHIPVLGVCLGFQCIASVFGARVDLAQRVMHGKVSSIRHAGCGVFDGLPNPMQAVRYHALAVAEDSLPDTLCAVAWTEDKGHASELMGIEHVSYPAYGVQFHPEAFMSEAGYHLLENFLAIRGGS